MLSAMTISRLTTSVALISAGTFAAASAKPATTHAKATIVVRMSGDASGYRFRPASVSAHVGDVVRFVNVSGGPHNVSFWEDSIPAGAAATLHRNMEKTTGALSGALLSEPNETYTVSLVGLPPGTYRYYCVPHLAVNMAGRITIRP
jgi:plastocyanin